jgi:seryl-tRNA synthetase
MSYVRENADRLRAGLVARHRDPAEVDRILEIDARWKALDQQVNQLRKERNAAAQGRKPGVGPEGKEFADLAGLRDRIRAIEEEAATLESDRKKLLLLLPQIPHATVPPGETAADNVVVRSVESHHKSIAEPKPHDVIGHELNLLDEERGVKVAGEGFYVLWGDLARMEHGLIRYMREMHAKNGYTEVAPPILINSASMVGTGQLPKFAEDSYHVASDDLWLNPTAEVPVTNLFRDEILLAEDLPLHLMAYTPCFRREASGHGVETRGIARVHQFDKVELVVFADPETSYEEHEKLLAEAELVLQGLDLPYRVLNLCTGDLPDKAAKCYDLELWAPASKRWLEISSVSNFETYQATRANIRYRRHQGEKAEPLHTLNGSGTALARLIVAILENYQTTDGQVEIPKAIQPHMGGQTHLRPTPFVGERELGRGRHSKRSAPKTPRAES